MICNYSFENEAKYGVENTCNDGQIKNMGS